MSQQTSLYLPGLDVQFDVEFEATPFIPAKISGPPEDCYPASGGEVDIISISINGSEDISEILSEVIVKQLKDRIES